MNSKLESGEISKGTVCEAVVQIKNVDGLSMLAAMRFVELAEVFSSSIIVRNGEKVADGKSVVQMSMLAAPCGSKLRITAEGPDAQKAIPALWELVEEKAFGKSARRC
jgi:phosphotransferase system HPr (HPr) family protein